jgi:hypothetical protein
MYTEKEYQIENKNVRKDEKGNNGEISKLNTNLLTQDFREI